MSANISTVQRLLKQQWIQQNTRSDANSDVELFGMQPTIWLLGGGHSIALG